MIYLVLLIQLIFCCPVPVLSYDCEITVDAATEISSLCHFWETTGLCPPEPHQDSSKYFLSKDMLWNLINIGSVPHSGIKQVRMHWLLDLVTYNTARNMYNFTYLDALLYNMRKYNLNPGFELMGSPSDRFTNFDDFNQVLAWMDFITVLAKRYISKFGLPNVSEWNFETWNEPDHKDFDNVAMSVEGFLKYYDACSEGLKAASESLIFGGPGGSCRKESFSKRCWALFDHCITGKNFITGKQGSRIDYISFHKKGGGSSEYILTSELETMRKIHGEHPALSHTPVYNDEGDPMVGWSHPYFWRADSTYPAVVAKIITQHQFSIIANQSSDITYALLSNDNGFLNFYPNFFTQRTLNARFQMNNTNPKHVHLVKKPIYAVMVLLSKLGDMQLQSHVKTTVNGDIIGAIASECVKNCASREVSVLLYASNDTEPVTNSFNVLANITSLVKADYVGEVKLMKCMIDNNVTNPSAAWERAGKPDFPSSKVFQEMHYSSEPYCTDPTDFNIVQSDNSVNLMMQMPGVALLQLCWKPVSVFQPPYLISVTNITSAQVLIAWSDTSIKSKCIKTFVIQLCSFKNFFSCKVINEGKVLSNSYVFISLSGVDEEVHGSYKVAAIDFWDRSSEFSNAVVYGSGRNNIMV